MSIPSSAPPSSHRGGASLIAALGLTQVMGYGGLYYAFAVLAPRITASFGWAPELTYAGFTAGLLAGGLAAPYAGRLIDRYGTRAMMTLGSALAGLSLLALAQTRGPIGYFAAMIALEAISTLVLYDAAFTALTQARGTAARRSISQLTLIGGFASTLFWPLTTELLKHFDWRDVYRLYACLQFAVCVPLHLVFLPSRAMSRSLGEGLPAASPEPSAAYLDGGEGKAAFWLLAVAFSFQGFVTSALSVHMLTLLQELGLGAALAVVIGAIVGPSQVAGRLAEMLFGSSLDPVTTAWVSAVLMPLGLALLALGGGAAPIAALFAIAYGISMGLGSIVRGTVPLRLFGPAGYGAMLGKLAAPGLAVKAAAPLLFAITMERAGLMAGNLLLVAMSAFPAGVLYVLAAKVKRAEARRLGSDRTPPRRPEANAA